MVESETLSPRSAAKRQDILDVAADLFAERGFEATSIKTLAAEAQVSTSTIYTYFKDKVDLLDQVIEARIEAVFRHVETGASEISDPLETLIESTRILNRKLASDPLLAKILTYRSHATGRRIAQRARAVLERIDAWAVTSIEAAVTAGRLHCEDPEALNGVLSLSFQGWLLNQGYGDHRISEDRLSEMLVTLLRGLAAGHRE